MSAREQSCFWCGEPLGIFHHSHRDGPLTCGSRECEKEARMEVAAERESRRLDAEDDNFDRYSGSGW